MEQHEFAAGGLNLGKYFKAKNLKRDLPASIVVFLVALPLCLGIALASGAPLFAGVLTGIIGGIVVGSLSGSQLSVAGPAAGLTVIVMNAIHSSGTYEAFLLCVVLAGVFQIILGLIKAGTIGNYFPSAVIEGMLAAIGIILILKQFPHAVGYDKDFVGDEEFMQVDKENTFSGILSAISKINYGAMIIAAVSISILIWWPKIKKVSGIPAALMVVLAGIGLSLAFNNTGLELRDKQFVQIPIVNSANEFFGLFRMPDFGAIGNKQIWVSAFTIAVVASLETLLSLEAVDKIDPIKRISPTNRELWAQGAGNIVSGLLGGLPMTAVIVRSSANVNAGARTKMSAIFHGFLLLISLVLIPKIINYIPLSCLAAILLMTGYKLARISLFQHMWHKGLNQFIPFVVTIVAVVFTDLLIGVGIGMLVGVFYILRTNMNNPYFYHIEKNGNKNVFRIRLAEEVSFLNKASIQVMLTKLPKESTVIIDGTSSRYIDQDVLETIFNYKHNAFTKAIIVELVNIKHNYPVPKFKELTFEASSKTDEDQ
ncbi:SulP family inorganic anion transporter [Mucilaginibacter myungsuensis]|uniref:SulP family inorganic anion transporter n=1 Tax=Mucilaginibacter myungsuensis TaxID=649104 RepID=A0A929KXV1_9SPHI|nr:SulP family inorganic anion transporter [Mucilaginibacter myungsuensis]MBE9660615.1 SulP family inorganic anion transporter [Mucilaginibacter myungsuensis]MDN3600660.1 SulP family inorganic anion transporter [Mucilaginibacter myungsuensis]